MGNLLKAIAWLAWSAYLLTKPVEAFFFNVRSPILSNQDLQGRILLDWLIPYFNVANYVLLAAIVSSLISVLWGRYRGHSARFKAPPAANHERSDTSSNFGKVVCRILTVGALVLLTAVYSITLWLDPSPSLSIVLAVIWGTVLARRLIEQPAAASSPKSAIRVER
jgi:hypothetical protein